MKNSKFLVLYNRKKHILYKDKFIEKVEEKPLDMKKLQAMPGILVYMVKPGDELWDIARKYHTSIQEIRTINALKENQEPSPGTPLLVVKKVEGQIK